MDAHEQFTVWRCPSCGGVAHPATGCQHSENVVVCGPCTRKFWAWLAPFTNNKGRGKGRKLAFYDSVNRVREGNFA